MLDIGRVLFPGRGFNHSQRTLCGDFTESQLKDSSRCQSESEQAKQAFGDKNKYKVTLAGGGPSWVAFSLKILHGKIVECLTCKKHSKKTGEKISK